MEFLKYCRPCDLKFRYTGCALPLQFVIKFQKSRKVVAICSVFVFAVL